MQNMLVQIPAGSSGSRPERAVSPGQLLRASLTSSSLHQHFARKKNRYVHVNQGLEEQEDKDSFHVLWAGGVVGSVSGQRFRNCCNCAAAWLFGLQCHSSICTCRHEDTDLPSRIICSVQLSVLP